MLAAIMALVGIVLGTSLTMAANLILTQKQHRNNLALENRQWGEERERKLIEDTKGAFSHYVDRIEKYASERRALILAINNPIMLPETVYHNLFQEIWKIASLADEASVIAKNFGYNQLSDDLQKLEKIFWEIWKLRTQQGDKLNSEALEKESLQIYSRVASNILELRARVAQMNLQTSKEFEVDDLPKLIDTKSESKDTGLLEKGM